MNAETLGSGKETHKKKSEGEIRRLQGDEVETHFEEGISTCPVIQNEVAQRDTDNDVRRNEETQNTCAKRAVNEHPEEVGLVVLKGVALQTPHTLHIEDCREQKSNRELAGKENGWNQTQELVNHIQMSEKVHLSWKTEFGDELRNT